MSTQTVRSGFDAWASSGYPALSHPQEVGLKVRSGVAYAFLWMRSPVPLGATVTSATLTLRARGASTGSRTVSLRRATASWKASRLNYNNMPAGGPSEATATIGTVATQDRIDFDVTSFVQAWANGLENYGWRIATSAAATHEIYGFSSSYAPELTVVWSDNPSEPTDLRPSEAVTSPALPHVTFNYLDVSGNTELAAARVQVSTSETFSPLVYDSGEVLTTSSDVDLAALLTTAIANGSFSTNTAGWLASNATLARVTTPVNSGPGAASLTVTTAGTAAAYTDPATLLPVAAGQTYTAVASSRSAAVARASRVRIQWYSAAGTALSSATGTSTNNSTSAYQTRTVTGVAPSGAASARVFVEILSAAVGEVHYIDNVTFSVGTAAWAGMSDGQTVYWRVQARDGAGLWSAWSDPVSMTREVKPTVSISNLGAGVAYDNSPPIIWSVTGGTQVRFRVLVYHVTDGRIVYDSKERQSSETSFTIPAGYLFDDWTYRVKVRVWDSENREATPGDPTYTEAQADFHLDTDVAVGGVTGLNVTQVGLKPTVDITWNRSTTPDRFVILRDGRAVATQDAEDLYQGGTSYRYRSYGSRPNWSHRWEVRAVVNGRTSATNPSVYFAVPVEGIWLIDKDRDIDVTLFGDDAGTWNTEDDASVYTPIGSSQVVRVVNGMRGLEGSLSGHLMAGFGKAFRDMEADLYRIKERPYQTVRIIAGDMSFDALIGNLSISPSPKTRAGQVFKDVSFDFWETNQDRFTPVL